MINKHVHWILWFFVSSVMLLVLFFTLLAKSHSNLEETIQNQVSLFKEEIVKASTGYDTYTLRRFSESFRGMKDDEVQFNYKPKDTLSCGIHIVIPLNHMGVPLGEFQLCRKWSNTIIGVVIDPWFFSLGLVLLTVIVFSNVVPLALYRKTTKKILQSINGDQQELLMLDSKLDDIQKKILGFIKEHIASKIEVERQQLLLQKNESLVSFASQVSHDIRSPLSALNMVLSQLNQIPEDRRIIIRSAVQRINDIANTMLDRTKAQNAIQKLNIQTGPVLVSSLVDSLISEIRVQFREKVNLEILANLNLAYGLFAEIDALEMKRVLSNLINNSVEAMPNTGGQICVTVASNSTGDQIHIVISDTGKGIPLDILERLGEKGLTSGKDGTTSGSGLGIYHAKKTLASYCGSLHIESIVGQGTLVKITLPTAPMPDWYVQEIQLIHGDKIVCLDDDSSIHGVWQGRLKELKSTSIDFLSFTSGNEFKHWTLSNKVANCYFLIDYELIDQAMTGLDLIEELDLCTRAALVTSRFEEFSIRERCKKLGVKLIPKGMAALVPIKEVLTKEKLDCVFLDDDALNRAVWSIAANEKNKNIQTFEKPDDFFKFIECLDRVTPVYIDENLSDEIRGREISRKVSQLGFVNVYIATGYDPSEFSSCGWLRGVVGKEPPF